MISNRRSHYTKFNWPAHCEGRAAAANGESHHNNPYDPELQSKDYKRWNEAYDHRIQAYLQNNQFGVTK